MLTIIKLMIVGKLEVYKKSTIILKGFISIMILAILILHC